MKKFRTVLLVAGCWAALTGCGAGNSGFDPKESSIYVTKDGQVSSAMVYTSPAADESYSQEELQAFVEERVIAYNTENGGAALAQNEGDGAKLPVAVKSCKLEGATGTVIFEYAGPADLVAFTQAANDTENKITEFAVAPVTETLTSDEVISFVKPDGTSVSSTDVAKETNAMVAAVRGQATVQTEGKILFVSEGATVTDSYTVKVPDGTGYIVYK